SGAPVSLSRTSQRDARYLAASGRAPTTTRPRASVTLSIPPRYRHYSRHAVQLLCVLALFCAVSPASAEPTEPRGTGTVETGTAGSPTDAGDKTDTGDETDKKKRRPKSNKA